MSILNRKLLPLFGIVAFIGIAVAVTVSSEAQMPPAKEEIIVRTGIDLIQDSWNLDNVVDNSLYVVRGTVVDLKSNVDLANEHFDKPIVYTDVVISVDEDFTQKYSKDKITVRTFGGTYGKYLTEADNYAKFELGEKVVIGVGLEPGSEMGDHYFVMGNDMGKYRLQDGKAIGKDYPEGINESQFISQIRDLATS